ncbi:HAD family phosphatase [Weissella diestrammenae]|uniref:HAD family phosphatase n=1 Tax=Weissella diestrammenae TaxID=1162633 RepID=A0A7G9T671_9LACO|nr:Cof-type HAD-IIB family hydrolase [Weissella diestrammenae]MCM0583363.1 HAD family phosphatase [Weissella diestrammenae]QNN75596.1 HAD family phosphatase [Weissella diestrammenae]
MGRKLIGIDLDHTTLNETGTVSNRTREVLQAAQAEGHIISIITGRPTRLSTDIYDEIGLKSPMINFNGALGIVPRTYWQDEYSYQINHEIAFDMLEQAADLGIDTVVAENQDDVWGKEISDHRPKDSLFFPRDEDGKKMLDRFSLQTDVNAILLHSANPRHQAQIKRFLLDRYGEDQVNVKTWGGDSPVLEVAPAGISKDTGLAILQQSYQINADDIYAFGDEMNDLEMIEFATHGIVMANGNPELKAIANDVTPFTNEEDGLARYLENLLKLA